ncbi:MAG: Rrf2 family transcriptional regulator [candidate division KSB1 bacterium]|nr:Rrf2 family transcriptional regulator [candidate division KSB1 bacterium]
MIISKSTVYALRALVYLVQHGTDRRLPASELAAGVAIAAPFFSKVVQKLVRAGILVSKRGPDGGVALARRPSEISLWEVVTAVEGEEFLGGCILGLGACDTRRPCPLHQDWLGIRERIIGLLRARTLADLAHRVSDTGARLRPDSITIEH